MDATCRIFEKEDIINTIRLKSQEAVSNCQILISAKLIKNINNTDVVVWINDLHKSLDDDYEAGIQIEHQGKQVTFYIDHIAYKNNAMIYFKGHVDSGKQVHFVKSSSELNIQLIALKRRITGQQKTPFGFTDWAEYKEKKSKALLN
ncbi:hypothetical protein GCM10009133_13220 [Cocleimonas flava]|uniref:Uncharacterized protein n=1 Tax=Cocleimonas flava TaxID=634765 RepID=A0A4R1F6V7_9GAMM|nr:DUF6173 family protein [Cocleimonas flava]TCJ87688.1 hypothetical protein EV695_2201 [Cocleimonas flava]